ncbi:hypothetical protein [Pseudoduganella violaceinigra]|uniref:hypothetical protein n=1 Tax=Pseudoduganella violaceinigra TaxID=246602 RepID=UPI000487407F|nr:hypothetical protein [Pseudoduganella violaceinigra]
MLSTAIQGRCGAILCALLCASACAQESNHPPQFLRDPILGLRLPVASAKLDVLPEEIRAQCEQMADTETWTTRPWIFGVANDSTATYYLIHGYSMRRNPKPGQRLYFQPIDGGVYTISGTECTGDPARETFAVRDPAQIPREVLQQLAQDLLTRLARAAGSKQRLRAAIKQQHIDIHQLSPEMQEALNAYFAPTH